MSTAFLPFILRVGRSNPQARLLSFFLGFGACFVWLAIAVEGLFYVVYSLTLCLWVEVESASRGVRLLGSGARENGQAQKQGQGRVGDDLRIAVFFLLFAQIGYFGPGK